MANLTKSDFGKLVEIFPPATTVNLPAIGSASVGALPNPGNTIKILNATGGTLTVNCDTNDSILFYGQSPNVKTFTIPAQSSCELIYTTSSLWTVSDLARVTNIATTSVAGLVKPDGTSITLGTDGAISRQLFATTVLVNGNFTLTTAHKNGLILVTAANATITLPNASAYNFGDTLDFTVNTNPAGTVTVIVANVADKIVINGVQTTSIVGNSFQLVKSGANQWALVVKSDNIGIATSTTAGIVKPDNKSTLVASDGTLMSRRFSSYKTVTATYVATAADANGIIFVNLPSAAQTTISLPSTANLRLGDTFTLKALKSNEPTYDFLCSVAVNTNDMIYYNGGSLSVLQGMFFDVIYDGANRFSIISFASTAI